jgi:uncharacterized membrane-anchored protein
MTDNRFLSSKLGMAATASIAAMVALNIVALQGQLSAARPLLAAITGGTMGLA